MYVKRNPGLAVWVKILQTVNPYWAFSAAVNCTWVEMCAGVNSVVSLLRGTLIKLMQPARSKTVIFRRGKFIELLNSCTLYWQFLEQNNALQTNCTTNHQTSTFNFLFQTNKKGNLNVTVRSVIVLIPTVTRCYAYPREAGPGAPGGIWDETLSNGTISMHHYKAILWNRGPIMVAHLGVSAISLLTPALKSEERFGQAAGRLVCVEDLHDIWR